MPSIFPQLVINGLISGSIYAMAAAGFALVYYALKFQYFSHGAVMSMAAYMFFAFLSMMKIDYILAGLLAIILSVFFALVSNFLVYRPLRKRKATPTVTLIASIGVLIFASSLILAVFGSTTRSIILGSKVRVYDLGIFTITAIQIAIIFFAAVLFLLLWVVLKKTKLGKAMRALADNRDVARVVGINPEKIYSYTFIISAALGAVGGILLGLEQNLYPRMGIPIIIKGFIGSVIGGLGSVPGAIIGSLFLGLVENLGIWFLPSGYRDVISFTLLLIFLLIRPQGIMGVKIRDS